MSLINFDGCLIPESNISTMRRQKRATEWVWVVRLRDQDTPLISSYAPSIVSVTPNASGVRMLLVYLYISPDESGCTHGLSERPIVAWRTETSLIDDEAMEALAIAPDCTGASNETWCYFDPACGEYWTENFSVSSREAAIKCLLEDLLNARALEAKRTAAP